jgi:hypothetical protein
VFPFDPRRIEPEGPEKVDGLAALQAGNGGYDLALL